MNMLSLNDDQLYHLRSLCQAVYQETGVWHQLHSHDEVIRLLQYSSNAAIELVYGYFCCFVSVLEESQYQILKGENILMPEGIAQFDQHSKLTCLRRV